MGWNNEIICDILSKKIDSSNDSNYLSHKGQTALCREDIE